MLELCILLYATVNLSLPPPHDYTTPTAPVLPQNSGDQEGHARLRWIQQIKLNNSLN